MAFWIKYEMIKKGGYSHDYKNGTHFIHEYLPKTQIVSKEDAIKLNKDGYFLNRKIYKWTPFTDWWISLTMANRITIVTFITGSIIALVIAFL